MGATANVNLSPSPFVCENGYRFFHGGKAISYSFERGVCAMAVKVIADDCVGCETCVGECPMEAISMADGKAVIDQDKCGQCMSCIPACPVEAIKES